MSENLFEYEAVYLRAGLGQLKNYLLQDEVYWNLGLRPPKDQPPYPQMTLGNLLLARARLASLNKTTEQARDFTLLDKQLERLHKDWQQAWTNKARKEFGVRLRQWGRIVDEISKEPGRHSASFANEVRVRGELELLKQQLPAGDDEGLSELTLLDTRIKHVTQEGPFVWESQMETGFSQEEFWFLRRRPKSS